MSLGTLPAPFVAPPPPKSKLGHYRLLSPNAGIHVSPIQLGAMSIGDKWGGKNFSHMDKEGSFKLLDAFYDLGGNFIDTANSYQDETSEKFIGEWAEARGIRDQLFIATKYSTNFKNNSGIPQQVMYSGNNNKSLHISVEASLTKLRTTYIDLLYVHWWDWDTSVEEVMRSLHTLILARKVLYIGVSDTPAWVVAKANQYARDHGLTPFAVFQGSWSVLDRSMEREIIPMARSEGMAIAPFNVLAAGKIRTDEEEEKRAVSGEGGRTVMGPEWRRNEHEKKVCKVLEQVASEVGTKQITAVAIAYVMQKAPYVFPILGGRKVEHLKANLEALDIALSEEHIKTIEAATSFDPGFPGTFVGDGTKNAAWLYLAGFIEEKPRAMPLRPNPHL